jgi:hypothetical protein
MKIVKLLAIWALVIAVPFAAKAMGLTDLQVGVIFLLVAFLSLTYQIDQLKTASGKSLRDDHQRVIREIEDGAPIEPKHNPPTSIEQEGFETFISDADRMMFRDFEAFGTAINKRLRWGGWRLQERHTPLAMDHEGPRFGRSYTIYYNALELGRLEVVVDLLKGYSAEAPHVLADVDLDYLQFFSYETARSFLQTLAHELCADTQPSLDRLTATVESALSEFLWETVRLPDVLLPFHQRLEGQPLLYLDRGELAESSRQFWGSLEKRINAVS